MSSSASFSTYASFSVVPVAAPGSFEASICDDICCVVWGLGTSITSFLESSRQFSVMEVAFDSRDGGMSSASAIMWLCL